MKVLQINIFGNLSTGGIAVEIYHCLRNNGYDGCVAFARNSIEDGVKNIKIGTGINVIIDGILTRFTDRAGFFSKKVTRLLIEEIEIYNPDIIHLHNLHGYYINVEELFSYLKRKNIPVVWTLHDCWAMTGHCCHFSVANCEKWTTHCGKCPQLRAYPSSIFIDNSWNNYKRKKEIFTSLNNLTIVTVSKWLENTVKKSFLSGYPVLTIYNGLDVNIFKPTQSNIKERLGISDKKIILGVASTWSPNKGLGDFIRLSEMIDDEYIIVIIGLFEKQIKNLPVNMIGLGRTSNARELAEYYSAADVFFNSSTEETFGLPTVEAMACGTPVIVYNSTALPEVVTKKSGYVIQSNNVDMVWLTIKNMRTLEKFDRSEIIANAQQYNKSIQYQKYINLYEHLLDKK